MIDFIVYPDGAESYELSVKSRDIARWEREGRGRALGSLQSNPCLSDLEEIAHVAAVRQGKFSGSIDDFRNQCDIEPVSEDEPEGKVSKKAR